MFIFFVFAFHLSHHLFQFMIYYFILLFYISYTNLFCSRNQGRISKILVNIYNENLCILLCYLLSDLALHSGNIPFFLSQPSCRAALSCSRKRHFTISSFSKKSFRSDRGSPSPHDTPRKEKRACVNTAYSHLSSDPFIFTVCFLYKTPRCNK